MTAQHSIPTTYAGINFRSRLEAKWAAFFTNMDWRWEYEPFDASGYIPDFLVYGRHRNVLVEVRPGVDFGDEAFASAKADLETVIDGQFDLLAVGVSPLIDRDAIGLLNAECGCWHKALWFGGNLKGHRLFGFATEEGIWTDRITAEYHKHGFGLCEVQRSHMERCWRNAVNITQWNPTRKKRR